MSLRCDLGLEDSKQFLFRMTLWVILLHQHTKFGNKMFCGSKDIIRTNIHWHFNLRCDLNIERSNPNFPQDTLAFDAVLANQVSLQTHQQFGRYSRNSHIFIIEALTVTLTLMIVYHFFLPDTPPYQVWLKMVERFRRYRPDKICHMDRMTDRQMCRRTDVQTDRVIPSIVRSNPKVPSYTEYV